jgi:hypothetical protein
MNNGNREERFFEDLADAVESAEVIDPPAPSRLKSRIYSALIQRQAASGPLASLSETKTIPHGLCIFEELVRITPAGAKLKSSNACHVYRARVLAELFENPPIHWPNCPYMHSKAR